MGKLGMTEEISESMWKIFIFQDPSLMTASTAQKTLQQGIIWTCIFPRHTTEMCSNIVWSISSNKHFKYQDWFLFSLDGVGKTLAEYIEKDPASGPKAHKCTLCGKVSQDRSNIRKHVENIHFPNSFLYSCKYCGKTFNARNNMYVHVSTYHRDMK